MSFLTQNGQCFSLSYETVNSPAVSIFTFCSLASCCCGSGRFKLKIRLDPYKIEDLNHLRSCEDVYEVSRSKIALYGHLNNLGHSVKFWHSAIVSKKIKQLENLKVAGLNGQTIWDIFKVLRKNRCLPFLLGGSVRDQLLDESPGDVDIEVDCTLTELMRVCVENWGVYNCLTYPNSHVVHVGNVTVDRDLEILDLGTTDSTFYVPIFKLEYTANSIAFDVNGNNVLIDLTGTGVRDACRKLIRIPSSDDSQSSWELWHNHTEGVLYRYWKLRVKGFCSYNSDTQRFVVENAKKKIETVPWSFPTFYCHYAFHSKYNRRTNRCKVLSKEECEKGTSLAAQFNTVLSEDFGEFWTDVIVPRYLPNVDNCINYPMHQ